MPNDLKLLNKLLYLSSSTESYKLTYNIHQRYNNLLAFHNDLELKVVTLEETDEIKKEEINVKEISKINSAFSTGNKK